MPAAILIDWIEKCDELHGRERGQSEFHFMDGPFLFRITLEEGETGTVDLKHRDKTVLSSRNTAFRAICESMASAAAALIGCYPVDGSNSDLDALQNCYIRLMSNLEA